MGAKRQTSQATRRDGEPLGWKGYRPGGGSRPLLAPGRFAKGREIDASEV